MGRYEAFRRIAEVEFRQIVSGSDDLGEKLRIYFIDTSYLDIFVTTRSTIQRFSFHWERRHIDKSFYRLDNTPDPKWKHVASYPIHYHSRSYGRVATTPFSSNYLEGVFREFMYFIHKKVSRLVVK